MRKILFRGKRQDNGEWVVSDTFYQCDGKVKIWDEPNRDGYVQVEKDTVGQYTGLTDKNGTKIFEGDILKFSYNEKDENPVFYSVEWKSDRACFGYGETADKMIEVDALHCEVVGNIHDNPELLKGE